MYRRYEFRKYKSRTDFMLDALGTIPLHLLDVGNLGDDGTWYRFISSYIESHGGEYTGLDSNAELKEKLNLTHQKVGGAENMPFDDGTFDAVYLGEMIEHTWTPATVIRECHRVLKNGGRLILDTPNQFALIHLLRFILLRQDWLGDVRYQTYQEALDNFETAKKDDHGNFQPQHKIFYCPAMLRQILEMHGFVLDSMGMAGKSKYWWQTILLKLLPHLGSNLCVVAHKATVQEAFSDVSGSSN